MKFVLLGSLAVLLGACGGSNGPDPSTAACGTITATGGCSAAATPAEVEALLLKPQTATVYPGAGGTQQIVERLAGTQRSETSAAESSTTATGKLSVAYNPATDSFTVRIAQSGAGIGTVFDDALYRTAFGGVRAPQAGVPQLANYRYLQKSASAPGSDSVDTFFYQIPGTTTKYVTLAGYVRNARASEASAPANDGSFTRIRSASVFGSLALLSTVPTSGRASYRGEMLATAVYNTDLDTQTNIRTRLDWISGSASLQVDFERGTLTTELSGTFLGSNDAFVSAGAYNASNAGRSFAASGTGTLGSDRLHYSGAITTASVGGTALPVAIGFFDGSFYGPNVQETGGSFRVQGGAPDQRVEILGAFTGAK